MAGGLSNKPKYAIASSPQKALLNLCKKTKKSLYLLDEPHWELIYNSASQGKHACSQDNIKAKLSNSDERLQNIMCCLLWPKPHL